MKLTTSVLAVVLLAAFVAVRAQGPANPGDPVIEKCKVILGENEIEISAAERGLITYLGVREGSPITANAEIGKIDDRQVLIAREAAKYALRAANARAKADVELRHAKAAALVAEAGYKRMLASTSTGIQAISKTEIEEKELEWKRAVLAIEKAEHDMALAAMDAWTKKAELDAAELAIELRMIRAPFDGQVAEVYRHQNEWVNAGDPILRAIRLDTLYVDGAVYLDEFSPAELQGCEVTVEVPAGRGETVKVPGKIVYVNSELRYGERQQYVVRAEITNRSQNGQWQVLPGQQATMTIHLGTTAPTIGARP